MKILFVTHRFPIPLLTGDRVRAFYMMKELALAHEVFLLCPPPDQPEDEGPVKEIIEIRTYVPQHKGSALLRVCSGAYRRTPLQTLAASDPLYHNKAKSLIQRFGIDLGHVHLVRLGPVLDGIEIPRFMDFMDTLSQNMQQLALHTRGPKHIAAKIEAIRLKRYEQLMLQKYHAGSITAERDKIALGSPRKVFVVPNGVELLGGQPEENERPPSRIVFCGRMSYFPNVEGACWFAREVFPLVRKVVPDAEFIVAGSAPDKRVMALATLPGVKVLGFVKSVTQELLQSTVAIAPMRSGTGIQNKVLEAMAAGTPLVATPQALGNIELVGGTHISIAESAPTFAAAVVDLIQNRQVAVKQAERGRLLVESDYSWKSSITQLTRAYDFAFDAFKNDTSNNAS